MSSTRKVIITCAVTGSGFTPTMSASIPYTVEDVVTQSVELAELSLETATPDEARAILGLKGLDQVGW